MNDPAFLAYALVGAVVLQRLGELWLSRQNTIYLLANGGKEVGGGHYPLFVILHGSWLIALTYWIWSMTPVTNLSLIIVFLILQAGRVWVISALGKYWTTRIIVDDKAPLIKSGPYRFVRHPNYIIVILEIGVLPLALGAWWIAIIFSILNGVLITYRIRIEDAANQARSKLT